MKEWALFGLFLFVGIGMLVSGIVYMRKEKDDTESVKIYRVVSIIGVVSTIGAVAYRALI
ncbi:hypothetical protein EDD76_1274 [Kineothrix alysoides]|uniref:Uncharacterized protein n=1 Tax=Kineothrix alysoides TaxID=1469948 RepID=A0A4R1QLU9_9FIRM|nr:hypothetical protein [Kineothrix alysoides]TCL53731.1 hypothetical protein EDD76_1274 [Kineothrix alysoides]